MKYFNKEDFGSYPPQSCEHTLKIKDVMQLNGFEHTTLSLRRI